MMKIKAILFVLVMMALLPSAAWAAVDAKGFVNGQDVDEAADRAGAIHIIETNVKGSYTVVNKGGADIVFDGASIDFGGLIPARQFDFSETLKGGDVHSGSGSIDLPDFVLSLKGLYNIRVKAYGGAGDPVITRTFWVRVGDGSPLTGLVGGTGVILGALAVLFGALGALTAGPGAAKGLGWRIAAPIFMFISAPLLLLSTGAISALEPVPFFGAWAAALGLTIVLPTAIARLRG